MNFIRTLLQDKKKLFGLIALLVIVIAIPVVVIVSQRQQEMRQRASGEEANLFFTKGDENPINQINLEKGKQETIAIYVNTGTIGINSFDIKVSLANILSSIENITITEADPSKFENSFFKEVGSDGTIRFSKGSVSNSVTGTTRLGLINFNVKASASTQTADIGLTKAEIASPDKTGALSTNQLTIPSSIVDPASSPTSSPTPTETITSTPTSTITSTPTPTLPPNTTATPTSSSMIEDINHDNLIDINDFNIWLDEFKGITDTKTSDINNNGGIDLVDYNIWFIGFKRTLNQ